MKKTVKYVMSDGDFDSQYGHFYKWQIEFQDGMNAEYLSKTETQNKFFEGQEVDVDITTREYNGKTINKVKPVSTFQPVTKPSFKRSEKTLTGQLPGIQLMVTGWKPSGDFVEDWVTC